MNEWRDRNGNYFEKTNLFPDFKCQMKENAEEEEGWV